MEIEPVYYCAGYVEPDGSAVYPYNLTKLLYYILQAVPAKKRLSIMEGMNKKKKNYEYNDADYSKRVQDSFLDTIFDAIDEGAGLGKELLGVPGAVIGGIVGGVVGALGRVLGNIFA